ncbi:helix-turn-helix domain-containing protein [Saccharopolyspora sp. NPDC000359]|uniref:helix-turn-helix domain-containing protein n=1 Tax=Saccharopolyspora sp. NPDC000359 TaxID=3154251 RepID=UPI003318A716
MSPGEDTRQSHRTIDRMAAILDHLARTPGGCTLSELAQAAAAPLTTTQGIVRGLVHNGYADQAKRRYFLGRTTYLLNRRAGRELLPGVSRSLLARVHEQVRLSVVLSVRIGEVGYYIDHLSDDPRFGHLAEDLLERPLLENAAGWVHLASMERAQLWEHLAAHSDQPDLVSAFLAQRPKILGTDLCVMPRISQDAAGIAMGIRQDGRLVSVVSVIGEPRELEEKRQHIVTVLTSERELRPR